MAEIHGSLSSAKRAGRVPLPVMALVTSVALIASTAFASPSLEFSINFPTPGIVSYGGGGGPLVGSNIQVDSVTGIDTLLNAGQTLVCQACALSFQTGNFAADLSPLFFFASGGIVSITGAIPALALSGVTLLTGDFSTALLDVQVAGPTASLHLTSSMLDDTKNDVLLDFFGLPHSGYTGEFRLDFLATGALPDAIISLSVLGGSVTNNVPGPMSGAMLPAGFVLAGAIAIARRIRSRRG